MHLPAKLLTMAGSPPVLLCAVPLSGGVLHAGRLGELVVGEPGGCVGGGGAYKLGF